MSRKQRGKEVKNSNQIPVEKKNLKLTNDSSVILKITEQGAFGSHGGNKELLPSKKKWGRRRSAYVEPTYHTCIKKMNINAEAVKYYTSVDSCPLHGKSGMSEWQSYPPIKRLIVNLGITAEGKPFDFEIID